MNVRLANGSSAGRYCFVAPNYSSNLLVMSDKAVREAVRIRNSAQISVFKITGVD